MQPLLTTVLIFGALLLVSSAEQIIGESMLTVVFAIVQYFKDNI